MMFLLIFLDKTSRDPKFWEFLDEITASSSSYFGLSEKATQKLDPAQKLRYDLSKWLLITQFYDFVPLSQCKNVGLRPDLNLRHLVIITFSCPTLLPPSQIQLMFSTCF